LRERSAKSINMGNMLSTYRGMLIQKLVATDSIQISSMYTA
jgi:hypothetical protein